MDRAGFRAPPATRPGLGAYLESTLPEALRHSGRFLANSPVLLVSVMVGGLVWWGLLPAAILAIRAAARASQTAQPIAAQQLA